MKTVKYKEMYIHELSETKFYVSKDRAAKTMLYYCVSLEEAKVKIDNH